MSNLAWVGVLLPGLGLSLFTHPEVSAEMPRAVFLATGHDFGTVKQGEKVVHAFEIRNDGTAPLTIRAVELSASGMRARYQRILGPGQQGQITLEWTTDRVRREVQAEAIVHLDDPARPQAKLALKGVVKPSLDVLPYGAAFFSVFEGETAERKLTVVNNEDRPLGISRVEREGEHFTASLAPIEPGKVYELLVGVPSGVPPGRYREAVHLHTDHPMHPRLRIPVNVLVKKDVYVNPEVVDFGRVRLDELARDPRLLDLLTQTIVIKKRQGTLQIQSIASDIPLLQIARSPEGRSQIFRIDVGLARDRIQPGKLTGSIRIKTDDEAFPELVVPVQGDLR